VRPPRECIGLTPAAENEWQSTFGKPIRDDGCRSVEHGATQVRVLDTIRAPHASPSLLKGTLQIEQ
jgi:hypothetical protein